MLMGGLVLSVEFGLIAGSGVGAGFTAGRGFISEIGAGAGPIEGEVSAETAAGPPVVAMPPGETEPPEEEPLASEEAAAPETAPPDGAPATSEEGAPPLEEEAGALSLMGTPALAAPSDAVANASGTAKSSDTNTAKRNILFIITPPDTLLFFF